MDLPSTLAGKAVLALYAGPLLVAALYDLRSFRIPNAVTGGLLAAFAGAALLAGLPPIEWLLHLGAGALVFVIGAGLFALRVMGGGDVKLLAAAAVWLGWPLLPSFALLVAALGGVLAVAVLLLRSAPLRPVVAALDLRARLLDPGEGIPYGVAIAAAALLLTDQLPLP